MEQEILTAEELCPAERDIWRIQESRKQEISGAQPHRHCGDFITFEPKDRGSWVISLNRLIFMVQISIALPAGGIISGRSSILGQSKRSKDREPKSSEPKILYLMVSLSEKTDEYIP